MKTKYVDLSWFDPAKWGMARAEEERKLFDIVIAATYATKNRAKAAVAAAELLRWYARFGHMEAPEVQAAIEEGKERVALKVAKAGLEPTGRTWVKPLDYFIEAKGDGGRPHADVSAHRAELRVAHDFSLSPEEVEKYLTTENNTPIPINRRAKTIGVVEAWLSQYVAQKYPNLSPRACVAVVRDTFPNNPWDKPETKVPW